MIDRHEVTNRQCKEFVDAGGYEQRERWEHPIEANGGPLSWSEDQGQRMPKATHQIRSTPGKIVVQASLPR